MPNIKEYAEYNGIDPNKVGEVILAAMAGSELPDLFHDKDYLKRAHGIEIQFGIQPDDTKEQVIRKIESAFDALQAKEIEAGEKGKKEELGNMMNFTRNNLQTILKWIQA